MSDDNDWEKYVDMVNNDNDSIYVNNALPEFFSAKKPKSDGLNTIFGKESKIMSLFDYISTSKLKTVLTKTPTYYNGKSGKHLTLGKLTIVTKHQLNIPVGFIQYSTDHKKITIFRMYIGKIYRKMNYLNFVYIETMRNLLISNKEVEKIGIYVSHSSQAVSKVLQTLGFRMGKAMIEKTWKEMEYMEEYVIKRHELM